MTTATFDAPSEAPTALSFGRSFTTYDEKNAPAEARPFLEGTLRQAGFIPAAVGRWAETPALMKAFFHALALFEHTSLTPLERETAIMAVARENECHLCQALHTAQLLPKAPRPTVSALREGRPTGDLRLDALTAFTRSLLHRKGDVAPAVWDAFLAAGFTRTQALEVVLLVATTSLSTMANRLVEAPVDPQLAAFAPGMPI